MKRLEGKSALITGSARGIGRAFAQAYIGEGATVAIADIDLQRAQATAAELGPQAYAVAMDVTDQASIDAAIAAVVAHAGRLDILINNVGGTIWAKPFEHYLPAEIEAEVRRSLFPTLWCCHAALPYMLEQSHGAIVNVSSIATRSINRVPYGAAKGGVNALTACLAFETAERGVRVNATAPGGTQAPPRRVPRNSAEQSAQEQDWYQQIVDQTLDSTLMKRYGSLDEQVGAILFLASDEASYITGTVLPVGGGDLG